LAEGDTLLTPEEVAERLSISVYTVKDWLRAGKIRGVKVSPRLWRVRESDLQAFIESLGN
jgi:excisionase family DNA binding protein